MITIHSYLAFIVLIVLTIAVINAFMGLSANKEFTLKKDFRISLFALIFSHIQLVVGLILYFVSTKFTMWSNFGMGEIMRDSEKRLFLVEHPLMNILAIVFITIGWSKHKKQDTNKGKFKKIAIFYTLGLLFLLSRIPWSQWLG